MSDYLDIHIWRWSSVVEEVVHALERAWGLLGHIRRVGWHEHLLLLVVQEPFPCLLLVQHYTGTLQPGNYLVLSKLVNNSIIQKNMIGSQTADEWLGGGGLNCMCFTTN